MLRQNFEDYPGFQQIPGMPILLQQSVNRKTHLILIDIMQFSVFID